MLQSSDNFLLKGNCPLGDEKYSTSLNSTQPNYRSLLQIVAYATFAQHTVQKFWSEKKTKQSYLPTTIYVWISGKQPVDCKFHATHESGYLFNYYSVAWKCTSAKKSWTKKSPFCNVCKYSISNLIPK